ncbi:DUF6059 family protein [Streptomyces sp. NPDC088794]|uniref:DUF6059 family protein n=1 Tax=Streptomyces sp. NPDC088794 TaxID=3365902 RepID=UPI003801C9DF
MLSRLLHAIARWLIAAGSIWVYVPPIRHLDEPGRRRSSRPPVTPHARTRTALSRLLHAIARGLIAAGSIWVYVPPIRHLDEPGPRHPERLLRGIPLSEVERDLERALGSGEAMPSMNSMRFRKDKRA